MSKPAQKNEELRVRISDINHEGFGIAREESGRVVFVKDTAPGDEVTVKVIKTAKSYAVAIPVTFHSLSAERVPSACNSAACGGCAYRLIPYEKELLIKEEAVRTAFKKAGLSLEVAPVLSNGKTSQYRNKAQFPVGTDKEGRLTFGYYARRSHRLTPADTCALTPSVFRDIAAMVIDHGRKNRVLPYDEQTESGLLRHIFLRQSEGGERIMLTLIVTSFVYPNIDDLVESVQKAFPNVESILLNRNAEKGNVILGDAYRVLKGPALLRDTLCDLRLKIAPSAFYQVNREMAEMLYRKAEALCELTGDETLLDLYCGTGSIGLSMAKSVHRLIGVEVVPAAVLCAKENALENGIENAEFYEGDAGEVADLLASEGLTPDIVILDPPRAGIDDKTVEALRQMAPNKIVYISCNPETLARDVAILAEGQEVFYTPGAVTPVDLFPRTGHVESVLLLTRGVTHEMRLHPDPFSMMKSGKKTFELRLLDEKRKAIRPSDRIRFQNAEEPSQSLLSRVLSLRVFDSFASLYQALPLLRCGYTEENVSGADASDMEQFYSAEEQKHFGVVGIEIALLPQKSE